MANEKRLIDANALTDACRKTLMVDVFPNWEKMSNEERNIAVKIGGAFKIMHENAPTVDAVEVVHGRWTPVDVIAKKAGYSVRYYHHAECKVNPCRLFECMDDYCPNCGAKMDGGNEDA